MDVRSFLAFELPSEIKLEVARVSSELRQYPLDIKWVNVDNIHLTVLFLGQVPIDALEALRAAVGQACRPSGAFRVALQGLGIFGGRRSPRVLWLGLNGDLEGMDLLRRRLQHALSPLGIGQEKRSFNPHLTLGRFRRGARGGEPLQQVLRSYAELHGPAALLGELVLFRSDLRPQGAVYARLDSWPLAGVAPS